MLWKMVARRTAKRLARIKTDPDNETRMDRAERIGYGLRVRDTVLWSPVEAVVFVVLIILVFGFVLGRSHYAFVAELFFPVIVIGLSVAIVQTAIRWRAGDFGLLGRAYDLIVGTSGEGQDEAHGDQQQT